MASAAAAPASPPLSGQPEAPSRLPSAPKRRPPQRKILVALGVAAGAGLLGWLVNHWGVEETDNAQLEAHVVEISSRIPGSITAVPVQDNQTVVPGQLLVQLDPRDARANLQVAEADLIEARRQADALQAQAGSSMSGAAAAGQQASADAQVAKAELERTAADLRRLEFLLRQGGVSQQDVDRARSAYRQAQGQLTRSAASRQQAQASRRQVGVERQRASAAEAHIHQAEAALATARLQLSYGRISAPSAGRLGAVNAEPGRQVQPGQSLMSLVSTKPWVEANFKETQLEALRPGQSADVRLDAFPAQWLHGRVLSVAPAAGSRFALLPPDNATGNFTKVVQRVTAKIELLDVPPALSPRLVPGLSATVRVRR